MKGNGKNAGIVVKMVKGETPYNAGAVETAFAQ